MPSGGGVSPLKCGPSAGPAQGSQPASRPPRVSPNAAKASTIPGTRGLHAGTQLDDRLLPRQRRPTLVEADGHGGHRRDAAGRVQPAGADGWRPGRAAAAVGVGEGGGMHGSGGLGRQPVRAPGRRRRRRAGGADRQPSGHPAHRRKVRRRLRGPRGPRGHRIAQRSWRRHTIPRRTRRLVQRGRMPVSGGHDGFGRVVRPHAARRRARAHRPRGAQRARGTRPSRHCSRRAGGAVPGARGSGGSHRTGARARATRQVHRHRDRGPEHVPLRGRDRGPGSACRSDAHGHAARPGAGAGARCCRLFTRPPPRAARTRGSPSASSRPRRGRPTPCRDACGSPSMCAIPTRRSTPGCAPRSRRASATALAHHGAGGRHPLRLGGAGRGLRCRLRRRGARAQPRRSATRRWKW